MAAAALAEDDEEKEGEQEMPPLDGSDREASSVDEKEGDGESIIATPGPESAPDTDDQLFIAPEDEAPLVGEEDDDDYMPSGTDADDEDEEENEQEEDAALKLGAEDIRRLVAEATKQATKEALAQARVEAQKAVEVGRAR